jgi:hypothetical protein
MLPSVQKGFIQGVNGCQEHQFKLVEAICDAKSDQKSQTVVWLDLKMLLAAYTTN